MGFKDNLTKHKDGSYVLKSKDKKIKEDGECIECGENGSTRDLLYQYNADDMVSVRSYIEEHLTMHKKHKSMKAVWCDVCKSLKGYEVKLNNETSN